MKLRSFHYTEHAGACHTGDPDTDWQCPKPAEWRTRHHNEDVFRVIELALCTDHLLEHVIESGKPFAIQEATP